MSVQRTPDNSQIFLNSWASSLAEPQHRVQHLRAPTSQLNVGTFVTSGYMKNPEKISQEPVNNRTDWVGICLAVSTTVTKTTKQLRSLRFHPVFRDLGFFSQQNRFARSARETTGRHVLWSSMDQVAKVRRTRKPEQKSLGSVLPLMSSQVGQQVRTKEPFTGWKGLTDWLIDSGEVQDRQLYHLACTDWHAVASEPANMDTYFHASNL